MVVTEMAGVGVRLGDALLEVRRVGDADTAAKVSVAESVALIDVAGTGSAAWCRRLSPPCHPQV